MSKTEQILANRFLKAEYYPSRKTILITAVNEYIPEADFKETFKAVTAFINGHKTEKIIFDKSHLQVFHQASMTWYHVEWKQDLRKRFDIIKHRKILPEDELFEQSVQVGKDRIRSEHPEFSFEDFDIVYKNNLQEALEE